MNFIGNVLDSIPVVGHVKGVVHYATGNKEAGNKSMYQATRTTTVLGAGAVGSLAGPGGAVAAAVYAGLATDAVASATMDEPQGVIKGCKNIGQDIAMGNNPTGSILNTGFQVAMDGVGGLGMGGVSSAASQISEKAVVKTVENVAKNTVATVGEKAIQKTVQMSGEEVVKVVTKKVTEQAVKKTLQVAAVQAEVVLVSAHVAMQAQERTEEEEREERERRAREAREERAREEREQRAREEREQRAREEREQRAREEREQRSREEREQRAREERERRAREEREQRAREDREQLAREREQRAREREQRAREERERRAREESEQRAREERERRAREEREQRAREEQSDSNSTDPPEEDKNNKKKSGTKIDYFSLFITLLEKHLDLIFGKEETPIKKKIRNIFKKLKPGQMSYLATGDSSIIERIHNDGILEEVLIIVIKMFAEHFVDDISFPNFLSLVEFVAVYMMDQIKDRKLLFRMSERAARRANNSVPRMSSDELQATVISCIMDQEDLVAQIVDIFVRLRFDIDKETEPPRTIDPKYRDLFSAVYHYFKHRYVEGYGVLSVREYFDWIRTVLGKLRNEQRYTELLNTQRSGNVFANVRFEIYFSLFGRRIRMIIKFQGRDKVLSSCFVVDDEYDGDEEGQVWLIIRRFPGW